MENEITKNFTLRYGTPWFVAENRISPINEMKKSFFSCQNIKNIEFNSVNKIALVQKGDRVVICDNFRKEFKDFAEIDCSVKIAHWSTSNADIIFLLTTEGLMIYNVKNRSFVLDNDSVMKIANVTNFCVFPKNETQKHELVIVQDGIIKFVDKIYFEGKSIPPSCVDNIQDFKEEGRVFISRRTRFVFSEYEIKLSTFYGAQQQQPKEANGIAGNQIIATDSSHNLFYGTKDGRIFVINDDNITALCSGQIIEPVGKIGGFNGFIENNGIFALSNEESYLVHSKCVIPFYRAKDIVCVSLNPKIISTKDMTIYISDNSTVKVKSDNSSETLSGGEDANDLSVQNISKLQQIIDDSFFERANIVQYRGECLKRRQEQLQNRLCFFNTIFKGADINETAKKYEALFDKVMKLKILEEKSFNDFNCKIEDSKISFNDTQK